jgi:cell wall-associated NlpC family hydrolase
VPTTLRILRSTVVPLFLAAALALSLAAFAPPADAATARGHRIAKAVKIVRAQKGDPYRYGAAGPDAFDCSGLVYYSYRKAGFRRIPRTSDQQSRAFHRVKRSHMRKGDLIFFHSGGDVYHVAVFTGWRHGHRVIIHASRPGTPVKRDRIWTNSWFPRTLR